MAEHGQLTRNEAQKCLPTTEMSKADKLSSYSNILLFYRQFSSVFSGNTYPHARMCNNSIHRQFPGVSRATIISMHACASTAVHLQKNKKTQLPLPNPGRSYLSSYALAAYIAFLDSPFKLCSARRQINRSSLAQPTGKCLHLPLAVFWLRGYSASFSFVIGARANMHRALHHRNRLI